MQNGLFNLYDFSRVTIKTDSSNLNMLLQSYKINVNESHRSLQIFVKL